MFSRLIYYSYFVVVVAVIVVKWKTIPGEIRLLEHGSLEGYLNLGQLVLLLFICYLATVALRRTGHSRGTHRASAGVRESSSLRGTLQQVPINSHRAFTRHPVWASIVWLIMAGIPVALVALIHGGRFRSFGVGDWVLVGIIELPIAFVASVTLASIWSSRDGTR
jgi:hypothetical protein